VDGAVIADEIDINGIVDVDVFFFSFVGVLVDQFAHGDQVGFFFHFNMFGKEPEFSFTYEKVLDINAGNP
jgi:hypothetical protein